MTKATRAMIVKRDSSTCEVHEAPAKVDLHAIRKNLDMTHQVFGEMFGPASGIVS